MPYGYSLNRVKTTHNFLLTITPVHGQFFSRKFRTNKFDTWNKRKCWLLQRELHASKFSFVSLIKLIGSKLSNLSAHVSGAKNSHLRCFWVRLETLLGHAMDDQKFDNIINVGQCSDRKKTWTQFYQVSSVTKCRELAFGKVILRQARSTASSFIYRKPRLHINLPTPATHLLHPNGQSQAAQANCRWLASVAAIEVPRGRTMLFHGSTWCIYTVQHFGKIGLLCPFTDARLSALVSVYRMSRRGGVGWWTVITGSGRWGAVSRRRRSPEAVRTLPAAAKPRPVHCGRHCPLPSGRQTTATEIRGGVRGPGNALT